MSFGYQVLGFGAFPSRAGGYVPSGAVYLDGTEDELTWTPGQDGTGSGKKYTLSFWVKIIDSTNQGSFFSAGNSGGDSLHIQTEWGSAVYLNFNDNSATSPSWLTRTGVRLLSDHSGWMHIMLACDFSSGGGLAGTANAARVYINGVEHTDFSNANAHPASTNTSRMTMQYEHVIGNLAGGSDFKPFYITDFIIVDGQQLAPTSLGEFSANGVWVPISPAGLTFGTNGCWLNFADGTDIGNDVSGNDNDFTPTSGIGATNIAVDVPANSTDKEITIQPCFDHTITKNNGVSYVAAALSNKNLTAGDGSGGGAKFAICNNPIPTTGKYSAKLTWTASTTNDWFNLMIAKKDGFPQTGSGGHGGTDATTTMAAVLSDGPSFDSKIRIFTAGSQVGSDHSVISVGQSLEALVDRDNDTVKWYANGSLLDTEDIMAGLQGEDCYFCVYVEDSKCTIDFDFTASDTDYSNKPCTRTNTGVGNFATWNPLSSDGGGVALSDGNLNANRTGDPGTIHATLALPESGKWAWLSQIEEQDVAFHGIMGSDMLGTAFGGSSSGNTGFVSCMIYHSSDGCEINNETSNVSTGLGNFNAGDLIEILVDVDNSTLDVKRNGSSYGSQVTGISLQKPWIPFIGSGQQMDYGQTDFGQKGYTPSDSNYKTLHTGNFPESSLLKSTNYVEPITYDGTGSELEISSLSFEPGFVIIKNLDATDDWMVYDNVRGATKEWHLSTNDGESTTAETLKSFDSDGFTLGTDNQVNTSSEEYLALCWKTGSSGTVADAMTKTSDSSTTDITRAVNTDSGISIMAYTGNGSNSTIAHGLGVVPKMVWYKRRDSTGNAQVWHTGLTNQTRGYIHHNGNSAESAFGDDRYYGDQAPTSSIIGVGDHADLNGSTNTYVAYAFAEILGFSKFGKYTGNGSTSKGPRIYTGFRPSIVLIKSISATASWSLYNDVQKGNADGNSSGRSLRPDGTETDANMGASPFDFYSNGFQSKTNASEHNASSVTYVYAAWARSPFDLNNRAI